MVVRRLVVLALLPCALALGACADDDASGGGGGPRVVATTTQVADLARHVAGERASVSQILEPNADPHDYEPRPSDARDLTEARLVLRSGGDLDDWLGEVLDNAGSDAETVTLIDEVRTRGGGDEVDPHWWQDPVNGERAVAAIRDALIAADPGGRRVYAANGRSYIARLKRLDRAIAGCMRGLPEAERRLVTDHDALGYFADLYDIEVVGTVIPALSTQAKASAGELADLVATIRREGVTTIFPESAGNTELQKAVARESGATVGPGLYADTLGPEGSAGATYLGSLRANAAALVAGFTGGERRCALPPG